MRFLRYPGGKKSFLPFLNSYFSPDNNRGRYVEPFVGGGSVFFHVSPRKAILADLNKELIDLYRGIRRHPSEVWKYYEAFPKGKRSYYKVRDTDLKGQSLAYKSARTLFLNRTCFKGMWRHDPKGKFNVGYGGEDRRWVITKESLVLLSKRLKHATLKHTDFADILTKVRNGDYLFLDPPYKPGKKEMYEAHYINGRFTFEDQKRLAEKIKHISKRKKVKWLMTNSSHPAIRNLYKSFYIRAIPKGTSSQIGARNGRSKEILISNFERTRP